ncbi:hypothetical protein [Fimbriiglobus ruber]|uniref:hypothetical protein n=1 Tax=Fimbriiglobus ruber TaxID=1908690 RepID=UPI00117A10C1|nr:hypothetical protein [Fimbriiglobus ruber]
MASRLVRARALLAKRLGRRGLSVSLVMLLSREMASAAVPTAVLNSSIQAIFSWTQGNVTGIAAAVSELTEGVLNAMAHTKFKIAALSSLAMTMIGVGAIVAATWPGDQPPEPPPSRPVKVVEKAAVTCTMTSAGDWVRVRVSFGDRVYHAAGAIINLDQSKAKLVLESTDRNRVQVVSRKGSERIEEVACDKIVFDLDNRKAEIVGAKTIKLPDRIGRILIKGDTKIPDSDILDKVAFLRPGEPVSYPRLEEARKNLAGFDARVTVMEGDPGDVFKDIEITMKESD